MPMFSVRCEKKKFNIRLDFRDLYRMKEKVKISSLVIMFTREGQKTCTYFAIERKDLLLIHMY